mgnify:CR=1 FL=1
MSSFGKISDIAVSDLEQHLDNLYLSTFSTSLPSLPLYLLYLSTSPSTSTGRATVFLPTLSTSSKKRMCARHGS